MTDTKSNTISVANEQMNTEKTEKSIIPKLEQTPSLRLPSCFITLKTDTEKDGKFYPGAVGFKYGKEKRDWIWMSYRDVLKLVGFLKENRDLVNAQFEAEELQCSIEKL